jgi:uncharacterized phage-associated protein
MLSAHTVARYLLAQQSEECGDTISNLKLQKLVYYAQGLHLAMYDKPLFPEQIKAWMHGPVVPSLYHEYNQFGANSIPIPTDVDFSKYSNIVKEFLNEVYKVMGQYSAWKLRNTTHEEPPWKNAKPNGVITHASMRTFFKTMIKAR